MCQASTHLFNDCPKVLDLDSGTRHIVFSSLLQARGSPRSSSHSTMVPRPSNNQRVHAITVADASATLVPFDESVPNIPSSGNDLELHEDIESHPDFQ